MFHAFAYSSSGPHLLLRIWFARKWCREFAPSPAQSPRAFWIVRRFSIQIHRHPAIQNEKSSHLAKFTHLDPQHEVIMNNFFSASEGCLVVCTHVLQHFRAFWQTLFQIAFLPFLHPSNHLQLLRTLRIYQFLQIVFLAIFCQILSHFSQPLPAQPRTLHTRSTKALPPFSLIPANSPKNVPAHPFHSPIAYATFFPPFHALCFHPTFTHLCLSAQNCCNPFFKLNSARPQPT